MGQPMTPPKLETPLQGIIPPLVTPLIDQDQIDVHGTERLLEHVIRGGVHGIFALGTTGEGTSLSQPVRHQFAELVCEVVAGRVPVLIGITETSMTSAIELAEQSFGAGASALVSAAPYYLPMTQGDLAEYTEELANRLPLPLVLYNMPSCTKTAFDVDTVQQLSQHENIIGVKDTSGDLDYFASIATIAKSRAGFTLLIGPEELLSRSIELGGYGGVNGGANMFPQLYVALYEAAVRGDRATANELQSVVQQISDAMYNVTDSGARVLQGIKTGLSELGICSGIVAKPFRTYRDNERALVAAAISEIEPLIERTCPAGAQRS